MRTTRLRTRSLAALMAAWVAVSALPAASQTQLYVATGGHDANPGTKQSRGAP